MAWADFGLDTQKRMRTDITFDGDMMVQRYTQDVQPLLDQNARERAEGGALGELTKVASIPDVVIMEWMTKYGVNFYDKNHKHAVTRLLNSSDYRYLKCKDVII